MRACLFFFPLLYEVTVERRQQRTVGVEERERVARGHGGTEEPGGDEALSLALADDADNVEPLEVLVQFVLQHICNNTTEGK